MFLGVFWFMSCFQVYMSEKRKSARKEVGPVRWVLLWTSNFLLNSRYIFKHWASENNENHQQENIMLIHYQILRAEIKRDVWRSVMRIRMCSRGDGVNSICSLTMSCLNCPVSGNNLPAAIWAFICLYFGQMCYYWPFFSSQFGVRNTNAYLLRSTNPISARAGSWESLQSFSMGPLHHSQVRWNILQSVLCCL